MTKEEREYAKQWRAKNQDKIKAYRIENKARDLKYQHKYRDSFWEMCKDVMRMRSEVD